MKNLLKVLFILISYVIFNSYAMEVKETETEKNSLHKFFKIERFENLPEELKCIITQQYNNQWWYLLNTFEENEVIQSAEFSPQDNLILYQLSNNDIAKLSDLNGNIIAIFQHGNDIRSITINHAGTRILTGSWDGTAKLWDLNGKLIRTFNNNSPILSVKFSPKDNKILIGSTHNKAKLWDLDGKILQTFKHNDWVKSVAFNHNGDRILTGSDDNTAKLWDLHGKLIKTFQHDNWVTSVTFDTQGDKILTGSGNNTAKLWDLDGNLLVTFNHDNSVTSVTFNPKGDKILTGSWDHTAKLWDLNGNLLTTFNNDKGIVHVSFSHKGDKFLTCSFGACNIWALYNPTLAQLSLRKLIYSYLKKLIHSYLQSEKPYKQIQNPQMLLKEIVYSFKTENIELNETVLNDIWNSLPDKVRNSFWKEINTLLQNLEKIPAYK